MGEERFPVFLKSQNEKSFYKISSKESLQEVQIIGGKYIIHNIDAKTLPERNLIFDLLENIGGRWETSNNTEFENCLEACRINLEQIV